jgi:hypothetical protein
MPYAHMHVPAPAPASSMPYCYTMSIYRDPAGSRSPSTELCSELPAQGPTPLARLPLYSLAPSPLSALELRWALSSGLSALGARGPASVRARCFALCALEFPVPSASSLHENQTKLNSMPRQRTKAITTQTTTTDHRLQTSRQQTTNVALVSGGLWTGWL